MTADPSVKNEMAARRIAQGRPTPRTPTRLDRTTEIRISERKHGPADARRYRYLPTYILRGLSRLYLEFSR